MDATLEFDGASRGNPGDAGYGFVLTFDGRDVEGRDTIGRATNNEAEYAALSAGLERAQELGVDSVTIQGDSELVIKQVRGEYSVNAENLRPMYESVRSMLHTFESWSIKHVQRGANDRADELANSALDEAK